MWKKLCFQLARFARTYARTSSPSRKRSLKHNDIKFRRILRVSLSLSHSPPLFLILPVKSAKQPCSGRSRYFLRENNIRNVHINTPRRRKAKTTDRAPRIERKRERERKSVRDTQKQVYTYTEGSRGGLYATTYAQGFPLRAVSTLLFHPCFLSFSPDISFFSAMSGLRAAAAAVTFISISNAGSCMSTEREREMRASPPRRVKL